VDAATLNTINNDVAKLALAGTYGFVPVVDGTFIADRPTVLMQGGRVNGQLYLAFGNSHEGTDFVSSVRFTNLTVAEYAATLFPNLEPEQAQQAESLYSNVGTPLEQMQTIMGDSIFLCPTYYMLAAFPEKSWRGFWAVPPGLHADDLLYYFNNTTPPYDNPAFVASYVQSYMSFARFWDVNEKFDSINITPNWEPYSNGSTEMLFNHTEEGVPVIQPITTDGWLVERCSFWHSVAESIGQ